MKKTILAISVIVMSVHFAMAEGVYAPMIRRPIPVCKDDPGCMNENPADIRVMSLSPANGASGVSPHTALVIRFSHDMETGTGSITLRRKADGSAASSLDAGSIAVSGSEAILQFPALAEGEAYYVEIPPGVLKSEAGYSYPGFSGSSAWSFETSDTSAPSLVSSEPADAATGVVLNSNIMMEFSEEVGPGAGTIEIRKVSDDSLFDSIPVLDPAVSFMGNFVEINPNASFEENTLYTIVLPPGAFVDGFGNGFAGISSGAWQFRSYNSNFPPTLANPIADASGAEGGAFSFTFPGNTFADGDDLTYSAQGMPAWLSFDGNTRTFSGTPGVADAGSSDITVVATDTLGQTVSDTFTLTIADNPVPAAGTAIPAQNATTGVAFSYTIPADAFADTEGLTLSATLDDGSALPVWLAFDPDTRTFDGMAASSDAGTLSIRVTATDSIGQQASQTFGFEVVPGDPCFGSPAPATVCADGTVYVGLSPDGNSPMYATRCDAGMTWDEGASACADSRLAINGGPGELSDNGWDDPDAGEANTVVLATTYNDTDAAKYCQNLAAHGHDDWYLPAQNELGMAYQASVAENGTFRASFDNGGAMWAGYYWSSTAAGSGAQVRRFSDGYQRWLPYIPSFTLLSVRCVRKNGPALEMVASQGNPQAMDIPEGQPSGADVVFSVTNTGEQPAGTMSVSIVAGTCETGNFSKVADSCDGQALAAGGSCSITLKPVSTYNINYRGWLLASASSGGAPAMRLLGGPAVGSVMSDGTTYVGNTYTPACVSMFVPRCDAGMTWNGSACSGTRLRIPWNNGTGNYPDLGLTDVYRSGEDNTALMVGLSDAASPYQAAKYCSDLVLHGHDDWFLPSERDINVICNALVWLPEGQTFEEAYYWTSSERYAVEAWVQRMWQGGGTQGGTKNATTFDLRCARRID